MEMKTRMNARKAQMHPEDGVRRLQRRLYCAARERQVVGFGLLYDKIVREDVIWEAWRRVSAKKGGSGIDMQTIGRIEKEYGVSRLLTELRDELLSESYRPMAARRVYIPKANGGQRPLGIPTVKDRVAQMAAKLVLEPLFEADFLDCSHGFRPRRSNSGAAQSVHSLANKLQWEVDIDLKSYFDSIPHEPLIRAVRRRVRDPKVLNLIRLWLKAGVMEDDELKVSDEGTPQGGVLSPLLSNIYLHEFDRRWDMRRGQLVRYADDSVILCGSQADANSALQDAQRLFEALDLRLNEEKTQIRHVRDGFDFLGFTFKGTYSHARRRMVVVKYPKAKGVVKFKQSLKETVKAVPLGQGLCEAIEKLNSKVRGWANYFKISYCQKALLEISNWCCQQLRLFWRRRKQCKRISGTSVWPNAYFYGKGLIYAPNLRRA